MKAFYVYEDGKRHVVTAKSEKDAEEFFKNYTKRIPKRIELVKENSIVWTTLYSD